MSQRAVANHQGSQETFLAAGVKKLQAIFDAVVANKETNLIGGFCLQVALFEVEYFIPHTRQVKAQAVVFFVFDARLHFFLGQPAVAGKGELHFIAVVEVFWCSQNREYFLGLDLPNARQVLRNFFLFEGELALIGGLLPFAATTDPEMGTTGLYAKGRGFFDRDGAGFPIAPFLFGHANCHPVSGYSVGNQYCFAVWCLGNGFAFSSSFLYFNTLPNQGSSFLSHGAKVRNPGRSSRVSAEAEGRVHWICVRY